MKKKLVNSETDKDVMEFLNTVSNTQRREQGRQILQLMEEITGKEPKLWGTSIVGFGKYSYKRKNGEEYEWFKVGFSPRSAILTVYVKYDINSEPELLEKLGKHKTGKGCLYIPNLENIDMDILRRIIEKSD